MEINSISDIRGFMQLMRKRCNKDLKWSEDNELKGYYADFNEIIKLIRTNFN